MAYSTDNPPACVAQKVGADGGDIWVYKDGDALQTVSGVNYISDAADLGMVAGDRVIHMDSANNITTDLTVVPGITGGTALGALCSAIEPIGETSIALQSAGTGAFVIDNIVVFGNGDETEYRITAGDADISGGGTLTITPGLAVATIVGTTIKVKSDVFDLTAGLSNGVNVISGAGATRTLTQAESGSTVLFDRAAGIVYTLPASIPGLVFHFVQTVTVTTNDYIVNTDGAFLIGSIAQDIEGLATGEKFFANGTTHVGTTADGATAGGLLGGAYTLTCLSATLWKVEGSQSCSATPIIPFTT